MCFERSAGGTPPFDFAQAGLCRYSRTIRAVSSVVEHLVYTERVGGSNPSPPILAADRGLLRRVKSLKSFNREALNGFLANSEGDREQVR
jgi:hypothetical protein